ncbi:hypothetical protein EVAR_95483_1 [Eumeta japonica]|uniref:Uncharacterized protein n=1 Tax=Eumeta variegata TaxID=151549 RepID=A0A4C1UK05_EUMVA|nr:hypothetical protein EVAR_95483_1 [Eumeta japonica]
MYRASATPAPRQFTAVDRQETFQVPPHERRDTRSARNAKVPYRIRSGGGSIDDFTTSLELESLASRRG